MSQFRQFWSDFKGSFAKIYCLGVEGLIPGIINFFKWDLDNDLEVEVDLFPPYIILHHADFRGVLRLSFAYFFALYIPISTSNSY